MAKKKKNNGMELLTAKQVAVYHLRLCFLSDNISPHDLHIATGVNLDKCIDFMSHVLAELVCGEPPNISDEVK
jgi:hypothetical protein